MYEPRTSSTFCLHFFSVFQFLYILSKTCRRSALPLKSLASTLMLILRMRIPWLPLSFLWTWTLSFNESSRRSYPHSQVFSYHASLSNTMSQSPKPTMLYLDSTLIFSLYFNSISPPTLFLVTSIQKTLKMLF